MLREIKGIITGQLVYNHKAYNYEQGCRGIRRAIRAKLYLGPLKQQRLKTGRQYSKALRITLKEGPYALHLPDICCVLPNLGYFSTWVP